MSVQDTLNSIEKQVNEDGFNGTLHISCEDYGVIKKALELQIPKKSIEKDIGKLKLPDTAFCPICDNPVIKDETDNYEQAYCCYCGQAIDWSDSE